MPKISKPIQAASYIQLRAVVGTATFDFSGHGSLFVSGDSFEHFALSKIRTSLSLLLSSFNYLPIIYSICVINHFIWLAGHVYFSLPAYSTYPSRPRALPIRSMITFCPVAQFDTSSPVVVTGRSVQESCKSQKQKSMIQREGGGKQLLRRESGACDATKGMF